MAAADYYAITQQVYISYFGRPADPRGLEAFAAVLDSAKAPTDFVKFNEFYKTNAGVKALVDSFGTSTESNTLYGSADTDTFINSIFLNVLGRPAKLAGLNYWNTQITTGKVTKAGAALAIMAGAYANTTDPVQAAIDQAVINNKVTVATNFTTAIDTVEELIAYKGAAAAGVARTMLQTVTNTTDTAAFQATVATTLATLVTAVADATGKTFALTANTDAIIGTTGNDIINSSYNVDTTANNLTGLDSINGGAGTDTLAITQAAGPFVLDGTSGVTITNVENMTVAGIGAVTVDATAATITGLTSIKVTQAAAATVTAASTTDVTVGGATGTIAVNGGKAVAVTAATANQIVKVGETATSAGAVSITHTNQGTAAIEVDGGNGVTITTAKATTGTIDIGQTIGGAKVAADAAKGAVVVSTTGADYADTDGAAVRGAITIDGGSTVTVTQVATASSAAAAADTTTVGNTITQSAVTINGTADTTAVTVTQSAAVAAVNAIVAVAGANETQTVTFVAMTAGEQITVNGLTFTASKALTAAQAAAAFANVANGAVAGSAPAANGIYTGAFGTIGGSTGAANATDGTVTFTSSSKADVAVVTVSDSAAAGNVAAATVTAGAAATSAKTGVLGVVGGDISITGSKIATATLTGFGATSTIVSDALATLNLATSNEDVTITNTAATTLALNVNGIGVSGDHGAVVTGGTYTTVNVNATGAASYLDLNSSATTLSIAGDKAVDLTGSTLAGLTTVTITGSGGATFDIDEADTITAFNAGATSGSVTAFVNGGAANYTGGSGTDTVTLTTTTVDKAINLGAGDDTLNLATGTSVLVSEVLGGTGTDTLGMAAADAATASATATFATKITSFEKLSLGAVASGATATVNLANLDDINYVISSNTAPGGEVQTFTVNGGSSAAVSEVQTIVITAGDTADGGDVTIGGVVVDITAGDSIDTIGAKIEAAEAAIKVANPTVAGVSYNSLTNTASITYNSSAGNVGLISFVNANGQATFTGPTEATAGDTNASSMAVAGVASAVALTAGMTVDQVGAAIAAAQATIKAGNTNVDTVTYNAATDTVSITYTLAAGNVAAAPAVTSDTGATFGAVVDNAVASGGSASALTLTNMGANGTLELNAAGAGAVVTLKDATGTADVFNVVTKVGASNLSFGTVDVAGVETVNITATDTSTSSINTASLTLKDSAVKSIVATGNAHLTLTLDSGIVSLTSLNASALTGNLTASTNGTVAQTITAGSGADVLTSIGNGDTLVGGAGNDTLTITGDLTTLTGGTGSDIFNVADKTTNVNSYATITDLGAGDSIKFDNSAVNFVNGKVSLADTAVFQDYANAAINLTDAGQVAWFQIGGNTYVIENLSNGTSFVNGTDAIVKVTGTVDLSTAAFSATTHSLIVV